jgi:hypothetical protein
MLLLTTFIENLRIVKTRVNRSCRKSNKSFLSRKNYRLYWPAQILRFNTSIFIDKPSIICTIYSTVTCSKQHTSPGLWEEDTTVNAVATSYLPSRPRHHNCDLDCSV